MLTYKYINCLTCKVTNILVINNSLSYHQNNIMLCCDVMYFCNLRLQSVKLGEIYKNTNNGK